jgi:hypothetical protein
MEEAGRTDEYRRVKRTAEPRSLSHGRMLVGGTKVRFELGDTGLPEAPVSGGSQTVASVRPAVRGAAKGVRQKLVALAYLHCTVWALLSQHG